MTHCSSRSVDEIGGRMSLDLFLKLDTRWRELLGRTFVRDRGQEQRKVVVLSLCLKLLRERVRDSDPNRPPSVPLCWWSLNPGRLPSPLHYYCIPLLFITVAEEPRRNIYQISARGEAFCRQICETNFSFLQWAHVTNKQISWYPAFRLSWFIQSSIIWTVRICD